MEVHFTHPKQSDTYLADVRLELTASQALLALHSLDTGPFLSPLEPGEHERLILRRTSELIQPHKDMASAGVVEGDIFDIVLTGRNVEKQLGSEIDLNWVGLFIVKKRKYRAGPIQEDFQEHVKDCILNYVKQSCVYRKIHYGLQTVIGAGAVFIPVLLAFPQMPSWPPIIISGIVAFATAITNLFKFGDRSHNLYLTAENMQIEYQQFITSRGKYNAKNSEEAFHVFMDRIEKLGHEHMRRSMALEKLVESQNKDHDK